MKRLHIAIAGGRGMIGQALKVKLNSVGHRVSIFSRQRSNETDRVFWDTDALMIESQQSYDVVVNLAGSGIMDRRWSKSYKDQILRSRVRAIQTLDRFLSESEQSPIFINASAIGFYGHHDHHSFSESEDCQRSDFLSLVCHQWEQAVHDMKASLAEKYILRIGVVLAKSGGAWPQMNPFGKFGLTPTLGAGHQFVSVIHLADLVSMITFLITQKPASGIYNATAPEAIRYGELARRIARRSWLKWSPKIPSTLLKMMLGESALMVLNSTKVSSAKVIQAGYHFDYPTFDKVLEDLIK